MKPIAPVLAAAALAAATLTACGGPQPGAGADAAQASALGAADLRLPHDAARKALFALDGVHTWLIDQLGPVDGWLALAARDVVYLAPNHALVQGRGAVRGLLESLLPQGGAEEDARTLAGGDVSADGRLGFTFGWVTRTVTDAAGAVTTTYGTYTTAWQVVDGCWRAVAHLDKRYTSTHGAPRDGFPLLVAGAGAGGTPRPGSARAQRASVMAADLAFAAESLAQGWSQAFVDHAGPFAMDIGGRDFYYLVGPQEIAAWWTGWAPGDDFDWAPADGGASPSGDLGYTVGSYVDRVTGADGAVASYHGTYLTLWRREADGAWKFVADGGNVSPAPTP